MSAIILDTETTGIDEPVVPVEVAYREVGWPLGSVRAEFCRRFNPGRRIMAGAMATHHIIEADVADALPFALFRFPPGVEYLVGHNVDFDWKAIGSPDVRRICTLALSRHLWPDADSHSLGAMLYRLSLPLARVMVPQAHGARADMVMCEYLLALILNERPRVTTWEEIWQWSEVARVPTVMSFGKHKGQRIADLPRDYVAWLLRQDDIDPYLIRALRGDS